MAQLKSTTDIATTPAIELDRRLTARSVIGLHSLRVNYPPVDLRTVAGRAWSHRPDQISRPRPQAVAVAGQRLRRRENLQGGRTDLAGAALAISFDSTGLQRPMLAASAAARCMLDDISLVTVLCSSTAAAVAETYSLTL